MMFAHESKVQMICNFNHVVKTEGLLKVTLYTV